MECGRKSRRRAPLAYVIDTTLNPIVVVEDEAMDFDAKELWLLEQQRDSLQIVAEVYNLGNLDWVLCFCC